jgi:TolB-like protein/DNA-binding winged helix-turn-helix (wHTH) protein
MEFCFSDHTLDTNRRELRRGCDRIPVEPQVFDLLTYLVRHRNRVVTKDDLLAAIWGGRMVSESTLTSRIYAVRRAVGDSGAEQRLIRTITRKGFRFIGAVDAPAGENRSSPPRPLVNGAGGEPFLAVPLPDRPAIGVLSFTNMSDDPEREYFSDGISEDIITALSKLRWFFVIARNSSFAYKGKRAPMKHIGEQLGVRYLVEGSVRKSGTRVRITAQLSDAATGNQLWAERYDRDLADVFAVQDEITEAIVAAIAPQIYAAENFRAQRKPPENLDAWDLVMRALSHFWRVTREDNIVAQALLEKAIAVDPNYAQALAVLAVSHIFGTHMGWEERAISVPAAERAAIAAVRADSEDPWAHLAVAGVYVYLGRLEDALAEFEQTLCFNPNFSLAQAYYGLVLSCVGRWEDGAKAARRALRLSPRDPFSAICSTVAAHAEFVGGNYHEAIRLAREGIRQRSDLACAYRVLTASAAMAGEIELAKASLQELRRAQPNISLAWIAEHIPLMQEERYLSLEPFRFARELYLEACRRAGLD